MNHFQIHPIQINPHLNKYFNNFMIFITQYTLHKTQGTDKGGKRKKKKCIDKKNENVISYRNFFRVFILLIFVKA